MLINTARRIAAMVALAASLCSLPAAAQQKPESSPAGVRRASLERPADPDPPRVVRFGRRAPRPGDVVDQRLLIEMRLKTTLRQGNELTEQSQNAVRTRQQRIVTTTDVQEGRSTGATVQYVAAEKQVSQGSADEAASVPFEQQPVHGKTYHCRREAGADGKLIVTCSDGSIPPLEEFEIVAHAMDSIGRANPLVEFLAGRSIAVGDTVALPNEVASQVFNLGEAFGEIIKFELRLKEVQSRGDAPHAVFHATLEAASSDSSQMRMQVEGDLVVETASCRAAQINLVGPLAMSESRGTYSTAYQLLGAGRLSVNVVTDYRDER